MPLTPEELKPFAEMLGIPDLAPESALTVIDAAVKSALDQAGELSVQLSRTQDELEATKAQVVSLSRSNATVAPELQAARDEVSLSRIEVAVVKGDMPPIFADRLKSALKPASGTVALSRTAEGRGQVDVDTVLGWFDGLKLGPIAGEQSGLQNAVALSHSATGTQQPPAEQPNELLEAAKKLNPQAA